MATRSAGSSDFEGRITSAMSPRPSARRTRRSATAARTSPGCTTTDWNHFCIRSRGKAIALRDGRSGDGGEQGLLAERARLERLRVHVLEARDVLVPLVERGDVAGAPAGALEEPPHRGHRVVAVRVDDV